MSNMKILYVKLIFTAIGPITFLMREDVEMTPGTFLYIFVVLFVVWFDFLLVKVFLRIKRFFYKRCG